MAGLKRALPLLALAIVLACFLTSVLGSPEIEPVEPQASKEVKPDDAAANQDAPESGKVDEEESPASNSWAVFFGAKSGTFIHGFIATLSVILVSELGDKTFFIAAIMAMRHPRLTVFAGAMIALAIMHVMSALFGYATTIIPRVYTYYLSSFLFAIFGLKMLKEGCQMSPHEGQEEYEEVQEDLKRKEEDDAEAPGAKDSNISRPLRMIRALALLLVSKIFLQALSMTFLAEWGDRSQLATIVLAAREDVVAVIVAGLLGHFLCTGLAVLGGKMIATRISVRTVTLVGGVVFLIFAATALFIDPEDH